MLKSIKIVLILIFLLAFSFNQILFAEDNLQDIQLIEVVHSIFYAPQYVAINEKFFENEGLNVNLTTAWGGDKAAASLLAGSGDIALIGPEPTIYIYNQGSENYIINFAQLTNTAGSFLVARKPMPEFTWEDVIGKEIIGNRPGGAPQMVLEYSLKERGIIPGEDVDVITNLDFTANAGAFVGGMGDFVQLFEPAASKLEAEGEGYVVGSFGEAGGNIPYTVYMAKVNYIEENPEVVQKFTNAIYKAQLWMKNHTVEQIAESIHKDFSDTDMELLKKVIKRYKDQGTWDKNPIIEKEIFEHYEDIIIMAGELEEKIDFDVVVNTDFAENAVETINNNNESDE
ncbi:MAG: ABC transporter substrate-binding protein [bacterium]